MSLQQRLSHLCGMTDAQLARFQESLRLKEAALQELLGRRDGIDVEQTADPTDEAQLAVERELKIRALDHDSGLLAAIRSALERIDYGDYGICQTCDGHISQKRLAAIPWALHCIRCQESIDELPRRQRMVA